MSRWEVALVRAALVWLVFTGALGVGATVSPSLGGLLRTTHAHAGTVGFFLSLVMGVAYWMMPRPGGLRQERLEAVTFWLLHGGLALRVVAEPAWRVTLAPGWSAALLAAALAQLAAMLVFALAMRARVVTADEIKRRRARASTG
ncbi:MAG: hypothetical protein ACNA8N_12440 [Trueperaceae bacterium]